MARSGKPAGDSPLILSRSVESSRVYYFQFDSLRISVALFEHKWLGDHVELGLVVDHMGAKLVLRNAPIVKLILVNFQSVLERLQKAKELLRHAKLLYWCSKKLLLWSKQHQTTRRCVLL